METKNDQLGVQRLPYKALFLANDKLAKVELKDCDW